MFRQILVPLEDRDKQRIIWRPSADMPIREYRLNTDTYGTDTPYQAIRIRTIHQTGVDNASPEIANIIKKAFYVDGLLYGADSVIEATDLGGGNQNCTISWTVSVKKWNGMKKLMTHSRLNLRTTSKIFKN